MNRREVWVALSDLFLDTETRWYLPRAAFVGLREGCSWPELTRIFHDEVAPVVAANLLDVAGDWGGFPEEWLCGQIEARAPGPTLISRGVTAGMTSLWQAVGRLYAHLAPLTPDLRPARERLLTALAALLLEKRWTDSFSLYRHLETLLAEDWSALQAVYSETESIYRGVLVHPKDPSAAENAANWRWFGEFHVWARAHGPSVMPICTELQYFYLCEDLAFDHPCLARLRPWLRHDLADWLEGPLAGLYGGSGQARRNWLKHFGDP